MVRTAVLGGTGFVGGELLRLLHCHPRTEVLAASSRRLAGRRVDGAHPHLRGLTGLKFVAPDELPSCDVLFVATPHKTTMDLMPDLDAPVVIDLSADFRLSDPDVYERYYGVPHSAPHLLADFTGGWPEFARERLATADRISVPGCMAAAATLAVYPLAAAGLADGRVLVDGRIGSSGAGAGATGTNLHAQRSGALRVFAPVAHRHEAEIAQQTGLDVSMTATGTPAVRGAQVLCHVTLTRPVREPELRALYRDHYADEPFVRIVAHRRGDHRLPDPKVLLGSNFCDVGFALAEDERRVVLIAALDNLVKGAAGNAVQCLNIRMGWPERLGIEFPGLHPL